MQAPGGPDEDSDLIVWGSSTLASQLLEHGPADEVLLLVFPVLLGTGKADRRDQLKRPDMKLGKHVSPATAGRLSEKIVEGKEDAS